MTEKRFTIYVDSNNLKSLWDDERTEEEPLLWLTLSDRIGGIDNVCELLNKLNDENEQLKQSVNNLKETIIKITIAYQRKYDRNIVNLVHEIHEEDISDLIKELQENDWYLFTLQTP